MTEKEYKSKLVKGYSLTTKIAYYLLVYQIKIIKHRLGYNYRSRLNPFNPLTYVYVISSIIICCFQFIFTELLSEIVSLFKWK